MANGELITQIDEMLDSDEIDTKVAVRLQLEVMKGIYVNVGEVKKEVEMVKKSVTDVTKSVTEHHEKEHLSDLVKKNPTLTILTEWMKKPTFFLKAILITISGFIILHLISTYIPNAWNWLAVFFGHPELVIPTV